MKSLVLHPTEVCQWHALVNEAQGAAKIVLNQPTESYLVFLLMRFVNAPQLLDSVIALRFLRANEKKGQQQIGALKEVGDQSLLFCGLFPGIAERRHVSLTYFVKLGQAAYFKLSQLEDDSTMPLYSELSTQFLSLQQILQTMRDGVSTSVNLAKVLSLDVTPNEGNERLN